MLEPPSDDRFDSEHEGSFGSRSSRRPSRKLSEDPFYNEENFQTRAGLLGRIERTDSRIDRLEHIIEDMQFQSRQLKLGFRDHESMVRQADEQQHEYINQIDHKVAAKMEDFGKDMQDVAQKIQHISRSVKNDWQVLQSTHHTASNVTKQVKSLDSRLAKSHEELKGEFDRVVKSLHHLSSQLNNVRYTLVDSLRLEIEEAKAHINRGKEDHDPTNPASGGLVAELCKRIEDTIVSQRKMMHTQERLEKQVKACVRKDELVDMKRIVADMDTHQQRMKQYVAEQMWTINKGKTRHVIDAWMSKKTIWMRAEMYRAVFAAWGEYMHHRQQLREALGRTQHQYAKKHIGEWVRGWWYIMQKESVESKHAQLQEEANNMSVQIEMLLASQLRYEKTATEQAKQMNQRIAALEKSLQELDVKKADKDTVAYQVAGLEAKMTWHDDLASLKTGLQELGQQLRKLDDSKYDAHQGLSTQEGLETLQCEVRASFRAQEERISMCAERDAVVGKADAKLFEDVSVLLAKQADQLANLLAYDMAQIKSAMSRFLELSPDIRKAALSVGLEPNEQCVACRGVKRHLIQETAVGFGGSNYKLDNTQVNPNQDQALRIMQEQLGLPSFLASSMVAGSTAPESGGCPHNRLPTTAQDQLRKIFGLGSNWTAHPNANAIAEKAAGTRDVPDAWSPSPASSPTSAMSKGKGNFRMFRANSPEELVPKSFFPAVSSTVKPQGSRPPSGSGQHGRDSPAPMQPNKQRTSPMPALRPNSARGVAAQ
mmetsp:Transcript_7332/g.16201  ORF Transcript_7332/g.16201 Transcript_7332/m.16201 type:complete len:768 (+) Transcript_7332:41-2344(+)